MILRFYLRYTTQYGERILIAFRKGNQNKDRLIQPMEYLNQEYWRVAMKIKYKDFKKGFSYSYIVERQDGSQWAEIKSERRINKYAKQGENLQIIDSWYNPGNIASVFSGKPFANLFLQQTRKLKKEINFKKFTHLFIIKAPLLQKNQAVCLLGSSPVLKNWNTGKPLLLTYTGEAWTAVIDLSGEQFPLAYKYGIFDLQEKTFLQYEEGNNRILFHQGNETAKVILDDGFIRDTQNTWKGAGLAIPVFSLRTRNSLGGGDFFDLKKLVDWSAMVGLKMIQLLPINDTIADYSWRDAYPYAAISAFALHPVYINLDAVAGLAYKKLLQPYKRKLKQLDKKQNFEYVNVVPIKLEALRKIYKLAGKECLESSGFQKFYSDNNNWLSPYAAFSTLRDRFKTADCTRWNGYEKYDDSIPGKLLEEKWDDENDLRFYFFLQFHLQEQLQEVVTYAHEKGIALKGDIPIGIAANSCDAWQFPELVNRNFSSGAPPDAFATTGQNWGFPIYDWQKIKEDNFDWWRRRLQKLDAYFDAVRLDHILGFFRMWSIPTHAVQGVLGHFIPCEAVHINEFGEKSIWFDFQRYCRPYITDEILENEFGKKAEQIKNEFLVPNDFEGYDFLPAFDTQQKIQLYFDKKGNLSQRNIRDGLLSLASNVILLEDDKSGELFHFRIGMENTSSFQQLMPPIQQKLKELYNDYFFERQKDCWTKEGLQRLPVVKNATNMLICGEDLGMVPPVVPAVMSSLALLSLEVQRMPKRNEKFSMPKDAPYLSVITPATHDMSTLREWWEEDKANTQWFYKKILAQWGKAPEHCEAWISRAIILQHLASPAMLSIFQLQDLLGMSEKLRRTNYTEERINNPADANQHWQYRMHLCLEDLKKEKKFNSELKEAIINNGR